MKLYVAGATGNSMRAILNIKQICDLHLKGKYVLEVVDIYRNPLHLQKDQIVAIPTLIVKTPYQEISFVGDLSDTSKILIALGLPPDKI